MLFGCAQNKTIMCKDVHELARRITHQIDLLETKQVSKEKIIHLLKDKTIVFIYDHGVQISTRDIIQTALEYTSYANVGSSERVKEICSHELNKEIFRYHIPKKTDHEFRVLVKTLIALKMKIKS